MGRYKKALTPIRDYPYISAYDTGGYCFVGSQTADLWKLQMLLNLPGTSEFGSNEEDFKLLNVIRCCINAARSVVF